MIYQICDAMVSISIWDMVHIVRTLPFLKEIEGGGVEVNFKYLSQRGESEKLKKGVEAWCWGRSS